LDQLDASQLAVRLVGPVSFLEPYRNQISKRVELVGPVPRPVVRQHYEWADVFVFPSICEGSATVTYEALAAGLPVITTPNAGSVVRDGIDGYIVPIRDAGAIADRLERLMATPGLLKEMSRSARERAKEFSWEKYGERLVACIQGICS